MNDLKDLKKIKELDPKNVYGSVELFLNQCEQVLDDLGKFSFPYEYQNIKNIVFSGMGGSALGAHVVYHLYKNSITVPFYINNDYSIPGFANESTLVILSSYSGKTEETLASANAALEKKCKITGITTGGELSELLNNEHVPYYKFNPKNNPCGQPRLGTGYSFFSSLMFLIRLGLVKTDEQELINAIKSIKQQTQTIKEEAIRLSKILQGRIPLIFAAEFLTGPAHVLRNQFNETSKNFSSYSSLPELNHHLMEGLKNPADNKLSVLVLESNLYSERIKKRIDLTNNIVKKNKVPLESYSAKSEDKLSQALEILMLGGFLTFYLSILYGQDPSLIPWVDYFKEKLK